MNSTLAKLVVVGLINLCFTTFTAQADMIRSVPGPAFTFTATCFDCTGDIPLDMSKGESIVSGTLTLDSTYEVGTEFGFFDFFSFTYDGLSNHVEPFSLERYDNIRKVNGKINSDGSFRLNLDGSTGGGLMPIRCGMQWPGSNNEMDNCIGLIPMERSLSYSFNASEDGEWSLSMGSRPLVLELFDFGSSAKITTVTAPSTIALFAFGLMGLASRRFKKQA